MSDQDEQQKINSEKPFARFLKSVKETFGTSAKARSAFINGGLTYLDYIFTFFRLTQVANNLLVNEKSGPDGPNADAENHDSFLYQLMYKEGDPTHGLNLFGTLFFPIVGVSSFIFGLIRTVYRVYHKKHLNSEEYIYEFAKEEHERHKAECKKNGNPYLSDEGFEQAFKTALNHQYLREAKRKINALNKENTQLASGEDNQGAQYDGEFEVNRFVKILDYLRKPDASEANLTFTEAPFRYLYLKGLTVVKTLWNAAQDFSYIFGVTFMGALFLQGLEKVAEAYKFILGMAGAAATWAVAHWGIEQYAEYRVAKQNPITPEDDYFDERSADHEIDNPDQKMIIECLPADPLDNTTEDKISCEVEQKQGADKKPGGKIKFATFLKIFGKEIFGEQYASKKLSDISNIFKKVRRLTNEIKNAESDANIDANILADLNKQLRIALNKKLQLQHAISYLAARNGAIPRTVNLDLKNRFWLNKYFLSHCDLYLVKQVDLQHDKRKISTPYALYLYKNTENDLLSYYVLHKNGNTEKRLIKNPEVLAGLNNEEFYPENKPIACRKHDVRDMIFQITAKTGFTSYLLTSETSQRVSKNKNTQLESVSPQKYSTPDPSIIFKTEIGSYLTGKNKAATRAKQAFSVIGTVIIGFVMTAMVLWTASSVAGVGGLGLLSVSAALGNNYLMVGLGLGIAAILGLDAYAESEHTKLQREKNIYHALSAEYKNTGISKAAKFDDLTKQINHLSNELGKKVEDLDGHHYESSHQKRSPSAFSWFKKFCNRAEVFFMGMQTGMFVPRLLFLTGAIGATLVGSVGTVFLGPVGLFLGIALASAVLLGSMKLAEYQLKTNQQKKEDFANNIDTEIKHKTQELQRLRDEKAKSAPAPRSGSAAVQDNSLPGNSPNDSRHPSPGPSSTSSTSVGIEMRIISISNNPNRFFAADVANKDKVKERPLPRRNSI